MHVAFPHLHLPSLPSDTLALSASVGGAAVLVAIGLACFYCLSAEQPARQGLVLFWAVLLVAGGLYVTQLKVPQVESTARRARLGLLILLPAIALLCFLPVLGVCWKWLLGLLVLGSLGAWVYEFIHHPAAKTLPEDLPTVPSLYLPLLTAAVGGLILLVGGGSFLHLLAFLVPLGVGGLGAPWISTEALWALLALPCVTYTALSG